MWYLIILNAFGVLAIIFKVCESQLKKRLWIIIFAGISTGCWMVYYLLNDNLTSALTSLIAIVKYIIFAQREKHEWANKVFLLYLFQNREARHSEAAHLYYPCVGTAVPLLRL